MIGLRVHFELGRYHATPWGSNVNDGAIEWPPSPWRLLRALYSAARTNTVLESARADLDRALVALSIAPPPSFDLPPTSAAHTRHYMPVPGGRPAPSPTRRGEKTAKVLDGFLAMSRDDPLAAWWDAEVDSVAREALEAAARSVGYLGRSESVCRIELTEGSGPHRPMAIPLDAETDPPASADLIDLLCPSGDDPLKALATSVSDMRRDRLLVPRGTRWVTYAVRADEKGGSRDERARWQRRATRNPDLALLRLTGSERPALFEAVRIGQILRNALQSKFGDLAKQGASPTFSGRDGDNRRTEQHQHAHYFSLPDPHGRRIDRLVAWAPEGFGPVEVTALASLRRLYDRDSATGDSIELRVALSALGTVDELSIPELVGPSKKWRSLTPFALVRHPKRRGGRIVDGPADQARRELAHRELPAPADVRPLKGGSSHSFRSSKLGQSRLERKSLYDLELIFDDEVSGPIAIGALSHYGLGLMLASDE